MASQAVATPASGLGVNSGNLYSAAYKLTSALANTETLTFTLPPEVKGFLPVSWSITSPATPGLPQTNIALTSHNRTTGVTTWTASGAVADASDVVVLYMAAAAERAA